MVPLAQSNCFFIDWKGKIEVFKMFGVLFSFLHLFICNCASSYDRGRVIFKRVRHWLFSGCTDVGKQTEKVQNSNKWK